MHFKLELKSEDFIQYLTKNFSEDKKEKAKESKAALDKFLNLVKLKALTHQVWYQRKYGKEKYKALKVCDVTPLEYIKSERQFVSTIFGFGLQLSSFSQFCLFADNVDVDILSPTESKQFFSKKL